jgi:uncharacterized lipoprotein YddW (UPF0748 family)
MKRLLLLLLALCLCGCTPSLPPASGESTAETSSTPQGNPDRTVRNYKDFKALWISQFDLASVYLENGAQRPEADYTERITAILANTAALGFNTVDGMVTNAPVAEFLGLPFVDPLVALA